MNKICTSLEQSKKLKELGIDVKTADMCYKYVLPKSDRICHVPEIGNPTESLEWYNKGYTTFGKEPITLDEYCIPAWSLSALLNVLPEVSLNAFNGENWNAMVLQDGKTIYVDKENPVDACYGLIIKLKELKLL